MDDLWGFFWAGIVIVVIALLVLMTVQHRHVAGYYLTGNTYPTIGVDVEWGVDRYIPLVGTSYQDAVKIIDSLNKTITITEREN